jgi:hypothetical protein
MKQGPMHLIVEGDECLMCVDCLRYIKNNTAFIRGRVVKDKAQNMKYTVGVVRCGKCEVENACEEATDDNGL